jgi:hypothetical protein
MPIHPNSFKPEKNEEGYILLGVLVTLVLLIVIGLAANTDTGLEIQIAANDRIHKETFFHADAGTQIGIRMVEESIGISGPITRLDGNNVLVDPDPALRNNQILIIDTTIGTNDNALRDQTTLSDAARDLAYFPSGYNAAAPDPNAEPHTNIIADGVTSTVAGAGLQMLAGYEGKGKGTAGGGGQILFSIYSQHRGKVQSESVIMVEWRHVIGLEIDGRY